MMQPENKNIHLFSRPAFTQFSITLEQGASMNALGDEDQPRENSTSQAYISSMKHRNIVK